MANQPHFITDPADNYSEDFRLDCLAWTLFTMNTQAERDQIIAVNKPLQQEPFKARLRRCQAWYWLTYLTRPQIVGNLQELTPDECEQMREELNRMQAEIKAHRQREFKTAKGATNA